MLFSMFISFLLARRFKGKVYVLSIAVVIVFVSLLSIGFPSVWGTLEWYSLAVEYVRDGTTIWHLNIPAIPLSFPFYASISEEYHFLPFIVDYTPPPLYQIELYFLTNQIWTNGHVHWVLTSEHIILLASSFFIINFVGAMFGYWISKTTFIDELLKKSLFLGVCVP
ncbi:MAG: hypothetical protein ACE5FT_07080 [Candidatus Nanoarchaeia archaeon]